MTIGDHWEETDLASGVETMTYQVFNLIHHLQSWQITTGKLQGLREEIENWQDYWNSKKLN